MTAAALLSLGLAGGGTEPVEAARIAQEQVQRFKARARVLPPPGTEWHEFLEGAAPVLVTAPHATAQLREGRLKGSDLGTGALAVVLHHLAGTPTLYTTWASPSDPNYYDDNPFKAVLARRVQTRKPSVVLDLHASREDRPYDVDFGTLRGAALQGRPALATRLASRLRAAGLREISDNAFPGERQATVVRFLHARGIPCIQLEINARWLRPEKGPLEMARFLSLARALADFVREVEEGR